MALSTYRHSPIGLGIKAGLGISTKRHLGNKRYPYMDSNCFSATNLIGPSSQLQPLKSRRLVTHASKGSHIDPLLIRSSIGFDPIQSRTSRHSTQMLSAATICASAFTLMAETQTLPRRLTTNTVSAPEKESLPMLDDGGSGFRGDQFGNKPYYRGDDSGAGGGGGGGGGSLSGSFPWGDFWFLIFIFFLYFLFKQIIEEGGYRKKDGTNKSIKRFI